MPWVGGILEAPYSYCFWFWLLVGTGKTLLAAAVCEESNANFIAVPVQVGFATHTSHEHMRTHHQLLHHFLHHHHHHHYH